MKLLVLTTQYPSQQEPTRGMYHRQIMRELQHFCGVRVIAPVQWPYPFSPYRQYRNVPVHEVWDGIEIWHPRYAHIPLVGRSLTGSLYARSVWPLIKRLHTQEPFDLIASYFAYPDGYAAVQLGQRFQLPVTIGALGTDINRMLFEGYRQNLVREALLQADHLLAVSSDLARKMISAGVDEAKVRVITNGVDAEQFHWRDPAECRRQLGLPLDRRILLFAGWLVPVKGLMTLVRAVHRLVQGARQGLHEHDDLLLALVGTGPLEPELRNFVEAHALQDHVHFAGARPHEEVGLWMSAMDIFCLPSMMEGCPNVLVEARASGKPAVASNVGGIPDLIPDGRYGILVPPADIDALTKALQIALEREWRPETILQLAHQHTWQDVAQETYECFEDVLASYRQESPKRPRQKGR